MSEQAVDIFGLSEVSEPTPVGKFPVLAELPEGVTDRQFREIIGAAYTAYTGDGHFPSVDRIKELCRLTTVTRKLIGKVIDTEQFRNAMDTRGVVYAGESGLSAQQMYCLQILTDPTDRRELGRKLKSAGVTHLQYRAWLKQPHFNRYLNTVSENMLTENIPAFTTALTNKALSGDLRAIQYAFEISGHHDPNKQEVLELKQIMQNLLEIITRHVKDPQTLAAISNELQLTMVAHNVIKGEINQ